MTIGRRPAYHRASRLCPHPGVAAALLPLATHDRWQRVAGFFLLLFAAALPHSIAAAQTLAALAALTWLAGLGARRQRPVPTPLDVPIVVFLLASALAAAFSLEPGVSVTKLAGTALALLVPVTAGIIATRRQALLLVAVLLASGSVSAARVAWQKAVGRGVEIVELATDSPLRPRAQPRDLILRCDAQEIKNPAHFDQLLAQHDPSAPLVCEGLRGGIVPFRLKVRRERLPRPGGLAAWGYKVKTGRSFRARGTFSHFTTYAEVMLQLAALAAGLWLAYPRKKSLAGAGLMLLVVLLAAALAATYTRASWAGLALGGLAMVWMRVGWRGRVAALGMTALAVAALNELLVRWRGVGFYNPADLSLQYRRMMWEDGLRLIREHPWLGIGMDTMVTRGRDLGLRAYEQFGLVGHFHSTPIQLGVERGLLGLAAWLLLMGLYVRLLVRLVARTKYSDDWWARGLALGILGATAGFLASGLVHYNFGDSEVVMVFWLLAGVVAALERLTRAAPAPA